MPLLLIPVIGFVVTGCKKDEDAGAGTAPVIDYSAGGDTGGAASAPVSQINAALAKQEYDAVVAGILAAQRQEMNAQEQEAVAEAQRQLLEAAATSEAAREAYANLSRIRHGR